MTRDRRDGSIRSETTPLPEEFAKDPFDDPTAAKFPWSEETIVKAEIMILPDGMLPTFRCRLCDSSDHLCSPIYNLNGGIELTAKHLDTINRLSDITITYEKDHASVVCSYCLLKIEEYTVIRELWQMRNPTEHDSNVPEKQPATFISCTEETGKKNASTQTTDYPIVHKPPEVRDASTCTVNFEPAPTAEQNTSVTDDGAKDCGTPCETIDVEQYCNRLRRKRNKRRSKKELISEMMRLVKRQFRLESDEMDRLMI